MGPRLTRRAALRDRAGRACELLGTTSPATSRSSSWRRPPASVATASRGSSAAYGLPPHRFQLAQRIRVARRLLERGVAAGDVAQQTGFFDQSHPYRHRRRWDDAWPLGAAVRSHVQDARPIET